MKKSERAKIFLSFSPMKSLEEALRRRELELEPPAELAEDRICELNRALCQLRPGCRVRVIFYGDGGYRTLRARVQALSSEKGRLWVDGNEIPFTALYDLELLPDEETAF